MARVKKPKPSARPMYPTSGRIHMVYVESSAMRIAWLRGELGLRWMCPFELERGIYGRCGTAEEKRAHKKVDVGSYFAHWV
jgi:hypothetical protein